MAGKVGAKTGKMLAKIPKKISGHPDLY